MQIIKGFVTIEQFINNLPGETALLGELSEWSSTYSKEKGDYLDNAVPGYKFTSFSSKDEITGISSLVSPLLVNQILSVVKTMLVYGGSNIRPFNAEDFRTTVYMEYFDSITEFSIGAFVDNGTTALPEWVSWESLSSGGSQIKIWLADSAFADQYDGYDIAIIPPVEPLDLFFTSYTNAIQHASERTSTSVLGELVHTVKNMCPETYIRFNEYSVTNPVNSSQSTKILWPVLIYGIAGDNVDNIKDALVNYILLNSSHTRAEWEIIIPDLFKRTEFTIIPRWDKVSVPNLSVLAGLYGSLMDPNECLAMAKLAVPSETPTFVGNNTTIFPYDYKAITLVAVNGSSNIVGKKTLIELFPDYLPVNTSSPDFSRMQTKTREWALLLEKLILAAETATPYTTVPVGTRRIVRNGFLFISAVYDNIHYLVAARENSFYTP